MKLPHRRQFLHLAAGAAALPAISRFAQAQTYPTRPVRIIVGYPPGGATDAMARLIAQQLSERLGQLPLLNSGRIVLPRNDRLVSQIVGLERRVTRAGKDSINHGPNGHDDVANCVAGVAAALHSSSYNLDALAS